MKSIVWILAALAVMVSSAVLAQTDSTSAGTKPEALVTENSSVANDNVKRAVFTTNVVDREPVDDLTSIPHDAVNICFFSEIVNLTGGTITHRWVYEGETVAEVTSDIGGPRWRIYSRKTLPSDRTGSWTVEIVDGNGNTLQRAKIAYDDRTQEHAASE